MGERLVRITRAVDALFRRELRERVVQQLEIVEALHDILIFATDGVVRVAVGRDDAGGGADTLEDTVLGVRRLIPDGADKTRPAQLATTTAGIERNERLDRRWQLRDAAQLPMVLGVHGAAVLDQRRVGQQRILARLHGVSVEDRPGVGHRRGRLAFRSIAADVSESLGVKGQYCTV
jgi:hypothetical protein